MSFAKTSICIFFTVIQTFGILVVATPAFAARKPTKPQCFDRKDNDRDGKIDFPKDRGCKNRKDNSERNPRPTKTPTPVSTPNNISNPNVDLGVGADLKNSKIFPANNPWNQDISSLEVDPNSYALISSIGLNTGLHPDFGTIWEGAPIGIPYVVVPGNQPKSNVTFDYADESDIGPYPIPDNPPIEGGPNSSGDRHILILDADNWKLYELFSAYLTPGGWHAGSGAIFDLNSNSLRPKGWTSADAAGLPILPGLVRYDEVVIYKSINHALRFTARQTRRAYVHPARHFASSNTSSNLPPMGMRVRLKSSVNISGFPEPVQVILTALKKYGMFLADNGSNWYITGAPDSRWDDDLLSTIRSIKGSDFEVVKMEEITQ